MRIAAQPAALTGEARALANERAGPIPAKG